nr:hypothetical protein SHINE37_42077 [Rhizobiaceae bacterium]
MGARACALYVRRLAGPGVRVSAGLPGGMTQSGLRPLIRPAGHLLPASGAKGIWRTRFPNQ